MKIVILAGGMGTRLSEETSARPKPMVEIGGKPILWHIMNIYAAYGFDDFVIACGYKGDVIRDYFLNFFLHNSDLVIRMSDGKHEVLNSSAPDWKIAMIDTGLNTLTGGRVRRLQRYLEDETFLLTYGDGVADVDIRAVLEFHRKHGRLATVTAVSPIARFGSLDLQGHCVRAFSEKPQTGEGWINGGFFAFEPGVFDYIEGDVSLEREPLQGLAQKGELMAYLHRGFWHPMDTVRDKQYLESLWADANPPWKVW